MTLHSIYGPEPHGMKVIARYETEGLAWANVDFFGGQVRFLPDERNPRYPWVIVR